MKLPVVDRNYPQSNTFNIGVENTGLLVTQNLLTALASIVFLMQKIHHWQNMRSTKIKLTSKFTSHSQENFMGSKMSKYLFWVDTIDPYHSMDGNIHCRHPPASFNAHGWVVDSKSYTFLIISYNLFQQVIIDLANCMLLSTTIHVW